MGTLINYSLEHLHTYQQSYNSFCTSHTAYGARRNKEEESVRCECSQVTIYLASLMIWYISGNVIKNEHLHVYCPEIFMEVI